MNRKEFNLLVEGWKSFLSEAEIPTIHQGSDPVQALGGRPAGVSSEEMTGEESEGMPPMYIENPNPEYDQGGMPIRSRILNPDHPAHEDHPGHFEYMKRTNEDISESRLRSIIKSAINEAIEDREQQELPMEKVGLTNAILNAIQVGDTYQVGILRVHNNTKGIMSSKDFEKIVSGATDRFSY